MKVCACLLLLLLAIGHAGSSRAATISYDAIDVSGNTWQYNYSITNTTQASGLDEFTVYFNLNDYANLTVESSPNDWSSIVAQPDPQLPADGFFDAQSLGSGLSLNSSQSGFSVDFTWLGSEAPGAQPFDIVDPTTFATLESGTTAAIAPVALPAPLWLLCVGILMLTIMSRRPLRGVVRPG